MSSSLNWRLLKKLYAIHTPSAKEDRMTKFIVSYLRTLPGVNLQKDAYGNLYAWKGIAQSYPCIVAHLDQVQLIHSKDFRAIESGDIIFGYSAKKKTFEGLGADDKNGILIALEALKKYDCIKTAFFREEEIGCIGSSNCDINYFNDCRFVIECDRRGNSDLITRIGCSDICSEQFIHDVAPQKWGYKEERGLITDVEALKERGLAVSCVNISCGYYNPHTDNEITVKRDLEKCWRFVQHIIEECRKVYPHEYRDNMGIDIYNEFEIEDEIYAILQQDPAMTASDLYELYHYCFPSLVESDYERIIQEFHQWDDFGDNVSV